MSKLCQNFCKIISLAISKKKRKHMLKKEMIYDQLNNYKKKLYMSSPAKAEKVEKTEKAPKQPLDVKRKHYFIKKGKVST